MVDESNVSCFLVSGQTFLLSAVVAAKGVADTLH
jgi:hypothetical protein